MNSKQYKILEVLVQSGGRVIYDQSLQELKESIETLYKQGCVTQNNKNGLLIITPKGRELFKQWSKK